MAKGNPQSKAAEKKRERIAMQRKMDARVAIVKTANLQDDPLSSLPSFKVIWLRFVLIAMSTTYLHINTKFQKFNKNDQNLTLSTKRVTDLDQDTKEFIIDLLTKNMKALYEKSEWGWNDKNKREEMLEDKGVFLESYYVNFNSYWF